ncbi:Uncharacterised protein [Salmonella enterica subsp. diarizonae]|uniref:Uncharacterized protein n=1 Tax=Salmonella diarizonae TaxID=59204 RepID=A0A379U6C9_SALDZ|nr:Uncharacterised protein [Salmonella enterica subsp. diarizonae]VFS82857.1 Uncharacterised protein [Salmonella enterica subsp. diarizonae]
MDKKTASWNGLSNFMGSVQNEAVFNVKDATYPTYSEMFACKPDKA